MNRKNCKKWEIRLTLKGHHKCVATVPLARNPSYVLTGPFGLQSVFLTSLRKTAFLTTPNDLLPQQPSRPPVKWEAWVTLLAIPIQCKLRICMSSFWVGLNIRAQGYCDRDDKAPCLLGRQVGCEAKRLDCCLMTGRLAQISHHNKQRDHLHFRLFELCLEMAILLG